MVLTQQKDTATYLASGEAAYRATESQLFANLTTTTIARTAAPGYPVDLTITNPNDTVFKVNGNTGGHKMGPSLLLKVMSGDKIDIAVQSFYNTGTTSTPNSSLTDVLASLATGVVNMTAGGKGSISDLNNQTSSPIYAALNSFLPTDDPNQTTKPKAYLNWILLDDQLKYVSSYPQSGAIVVGSAGTLNTIGYTGLPITKNGFLYIWVSNETPNWDAFFDNLVVKQYAGPLLEETHYYPFGLTMAAISSKALKPFYAENKYRYNKGSELQNKEFSDGGGLEMYETPLRELDPQLGRWWQVDSKPNVGESPYSAMGNNPILNTDLQGDSIPGCKNCIADIPIAKESTNIKINSVKLGEKIKKTEPAIRFRVTKGAQIALKLGKFGVDANFGSKEVAKGTDLNPVQKTDPNKTIKGGGIQLGVIGLSREESSTTTNTPGVPNSLFSNQDVNTTTTEATNTLSFLDVVEVQKTWTYQQSDAPGQENDITAISNTGTHVSLGGDIKNEASGSVKGTSFQVGAVYKVDVTVNFKQLLTNLWNDINTGGN